MKLDVLVSKPGVITVEVSPGIVKVTQGKELLGRKQL